MDVVLCERGTAARLAADVIEHVLRDPAVPAPVLGLATGSTPLAVYDELVRRHRTRGLSFAHAQVFTLDEYVGLAAGHPERYRRVIARELTGRVDLPVDALHGPDDQAEDLREACTRYEAQIAAAGGIDVQVLGVGANGHLAFNEPGSSLASRTRLAVLTEQTRRDNARFFSGAVEDVPRHCLTQGLGTIMAARHVLLLAFGEAKAEAVAHLVEGSISARWPATVLQAHPRATILVDESAGSRLALAEDYRAAWAHRLEGVHD